MFRITNTFFHEKQMFKETHDYSNLHSSVTVRLRRIVTLA